MLSLNRNFLCCDDFTEVAPKALWCEGEDRADYVLSRDYYEWYLSYAVHLRRQPKRILEIGLRYGYSAVAMMLGALRRSGFVECWAFDDASYGVDPLDQVERIEAMFDPGKVGLVFRRQDTRRIDRLGGTAGLFDIIHVDGFHASDASAEARDLKLVAPLLQPGGVIIVDDATDGRSSMLEVIPEVGRSLGLNWAYAPTCRGHILLFSGSLEETFDLPPGSIEGRTMDGPGEVRDGTLDRYTYDEVVTNNCYHLNSRIADATVVDIGAHIGFFCDLCLSMGASFVDAYEANPNNHSTGLRRMGGGSSESLRYRNLAVWSESGSTIGIAIDDGVNTGSSTVMSDGTNVVQVPTITLDEILAEIGRPIDLLKVDCEGAEYPILYGSDLSSISSIVGEFHPFTVVDEEAGGVVRKLRDDVSWMIDRANGDRLMDHLRSEGFRTWHHPGGLFAATREEDPPLDFDFGWSET